MSSVDAWSIEKALLAPEEGGLLHAELKTLIKKNPEKLHKNVKRDVHCTCFKYSAEVKVLDNLVTLQTVVNTVL